jgi:hypothetical protein
MALLRSSSLQPHVSGIRIEAGVFLVSSKLPVNVDVRFDGWN